jgi:predicted transcriptional regulator
VAQRQWGQAAVRWTGGSLPAAHGWLWPAIIIRDRRAAGLTQQQRAELAGTRQETISRIESGNHSASVKLVDKIDRALKQAQTAKAKKHT